MIFTADLKDAAQLCNAVAGTQDNTQDTLIMAGRDGVSLLASDHLVYVKVRVADGVEEPWRASVSSKKLADSAGAAGGPISIEPVVTEVERFGGSRQEITSLRMRRDGWRFNLRTTGRWHPWDSSLGLEYELIGELNPSRLSDCLGSASGFTGGKSASHRLFDGAYIASSRGKLIVMSTNGSSVIFIREVSDWSGEPLSRHIPNAMLTKVRKCLVGDSGVLAISEDLCRIESGDVVCLFRTQPNGIAGIEKMDEMHWTAREDEIQFKTVDLARALKTISAAEDKDTLRMYVGLMIGRAGATIYGKNEQSKDAAGSVDIPFEGLSGICTELPLEPLVKIASEKVENLTFAECREGLATAISSDDFRLYVARREIEMINGIDRETGIMCRVWVAQDRSGSVFGAFEVSEDKVARKDVEKASLFSAGKTAPLTEGCTVYEAVCGTLEASDDTQKRIRILREALGQAMKAARRAAAEFPDLCERTNP